MFQHQTARKHWGKGFDDWALVDRRNSNTTGGALGRKIKGYSSYQEASRAQGPHQCVKQLSCDIADGELVFSTDIVPIINLRFGR